MPSSNCFETEKRLGPHQCKCSQTYSPSWVQLPGHCHFKSTYLVLVEFTYHKEEYNEFTNRRWTKKMIEWRTRQKAHHC